MNETPHVADAEEDPFIIYNVTPDYCLIKKKPFPFDIIQELKSEKSGYASTVFARSEKMLLVDSFIEGVKGNAGEGKWSGVSLAGGHSQIKTGASTVLIEDRLAARHNDTGYMNIKIED
jgi:hypothetical protein